MANFKKTTTTQPNTTNQAPEICEINITIRSSTLFGIRVFVPLSSWWVSFSASMAAPSDIYFGRFQKKTSVGSLYISLVDIYIYIKFYICMYTQSYSIPVTETDLPLDQAELAAISLHSQVATVHLTGLVDSCAPLDFRRMNV